MRKQWTSETAEAVRAETGLHDPVQGAILLAEVLTRECDVVRGAESLDLLASWREAKIERAPLGKEAGQLVPPASDAEPYLILVNEAHPLRRQNFSAAHEIGHLLMPNYSPRRGTIRDWDVLRLNPQDEEEFLCDVAAAEILMPRRHFKPRLSHEGLSINTVFQLAQEFGVSLEAALLNAVSNSGADVAGMVWELDYDKQGAAKAAHGCFDFGEEFESKAEKKWRVTKSFTSGGMSQFIFINRRSAAEDSPTAQAGVWVVEGRSRTFRGQQILKPTCGECEFYIESRGYTFKKTGQEEPSTKVISLVWKEEPVDIP